MRKLVLFPAALMLLLSCQRVQHADETSTVADTGTTMKVTATDTAPETVGIVPPAPVKVTLADFTIGMPDSILVGRTTLEVTNSGKRKHSLVVEGNGTEQKLEKDLEPGQTATLDVDLRPGTYRVYCPVGDHDKKRGMTRPLIVR